MASKRTKAPKVPPVAPSGPSGQDADTDPEGLNAKELAFVDALAAGENLKVGAKVAGIGYRTAKRWHVQPNIAAAIRARVTASLSQARAVLANGAAKAARSLEELSAKADTDAARVSAAKAIIDGAVRLVEVGELEAAVAELEAKLKGGGA